MAVILPDEIRSIENKSLDQKFQILHQYIQYMKEQIDFWGSNREANINKINALIEPLTTLQIYDTEGNLIWPSNSEGE